MEGGIVVLEKSRNTFVSASWPIWRTRSSFALGSSVSDWSSGLRPKEQAWFFIF